MNFVYGKNLHSFHDGQKEMGSSHCDTQHCGIGLAIKPFEPFVLLGIKVHPYTKNKLRLWEESSFFFVTDEEKWIVPIGIHDIAALVSRKNHLNSSFCWELKFILRRGRTSFMEKI